jgi:hypothetical protein
MTPIPKSAALIPLIELDINKMHGSLKNIVNAVHQAHLEYRVLVIKYLSSMETPTTTLGESVQRSVLLYDAIMLKNSLPGAIQEIIQNILPVLWKESKSTAEYHSAISCTLPRIEKSVEFITKDFKRYLEHHKKI